MFWRNLYLTLGWPLHFTAVILSLHCTLQSFGGDLGEKNPRKIPIGSPSQVVRHPGGGARRS